ncbi:MAG: SDR family NAD(P)-dependent oxidoreductase [Acidimicrobiales bacterium]|jgi:NAD(P)-dependent dehydrogenase (short-subunit alcohol dehydrogenase family)
MTPQGETGYATIGSPRLQGKRALVTGSGTGIGREIALEFARQGADVVLHYSSSREGAESAVEEINESGGRASCLRAHLGDVDDCVNLVEYAVSFLGGLDILVNNAGITEWGPFDEVTPEQFDGLYNVNIRGQFFCAQCAVKHMGEHGGAIVNMTSVHGLEGQSGHSIYAGTKGAIIAWTRALAIELAPRKIRVNAVAPGWIVVPSHYLRYENYSVEEGGKQIPWGRVGVPLDIAKACVFLASDEADYIVGTVLPVEGGLTSVLPLAD